MLKSAVIKSDRGEYFPAESHKKARELAEEKGVPYARVRSFKEGFLSDRKDGEDGYFRNRKSGYKEAKESGQIVGDLRGLGTFGVLVSEDVELTPQDIEFAKMLAANKNAEVAKRRALTSSVHRKSPKEFAPSQPS